MNVSFRPFQPAFGKSPASEQCRKNIRESYAESACVAPSEVSFEQELGTLKALLSLQIQQHERIKGDINVLKEAIQDCEIDKHNKEADKRRWEEMPAITYAGGSKQDELVFRLGRVRERIEVLKGRIGTETEEKRDAMQLEQLQQRELEIMRSIIENSHQFQPRHYGNEMSSRDVLVRDLKLVLGQE